METAQVDAKHHGVFKELECINPQDISRILVDGWPCLKAWKKLFPKITVLLSAHFTVVYVIVLAKNTKSLPRCGHQIMGLLQGRIKDHSHREFAGFLNGVEIRRMEFPTLLQPNQEAQG